MRLVYYSGNNFGDKLNPIIFNRYLPNFFTDDEDQVFLGIGTIFGIKNLYEGASTKHIFSSGYGYGEIPKIDESYNFICVRGPLTAKKIGLEPNKAITDGAILIKNLVGDDVLSPQNKKPSYMPHWSSEFKFDWKSICSQHNIQYLSPSEDVFSLLNKIRNSKYVITEALHGAIIADLFRVPWIPVRVYNSFNDFKWQDWALSMKIKYDTVSFPPLYTNQHRFILKFKRIIGAYAGGLLGPSAFNVYNAFYNTQRNIDFVHKKFEEILLEEKFFLSQDAVLELKHSQLEEKLMSFYKTYKGQFA